MHGTFQQFTYSELILPNLVTPLYHFNHFRIVAKDKNRSEKSNNSSQARASMTVKNQIKAVSDVQL